MKIDITSQPIFNISRAINKHDKGQDLALIYYSKTPIIDDLNCKSIIRLPRDTIWHMHSDWWNGYSTSPTYQFEGIPIYDATPWRQEGLYLYNLEDLYMCVSLSDIFLLNDLEL